MRHKSCVLVNKLRNVFSPCHNNGSTYLQPRFYNRIYKWLSRVSLFIAKLNQASIKTKQYGLQHIINAWRLQKNMNQTRIQTVLRNKFSHYELPTGMNETRLKEARKPAQELKICISLSCGTYYKELELLNDPIESKYR